MSKVYIIAEAGVNHNGSISIAMRLIQKAAEAGADAVKFQSFVTEELVCENAPKAAYQKTTTGHGGSQFKMLKKLELSVSDHTALIAHCRKYGIAFLSTPFDDPSLDLLQKLGLKTIKISSGDINNLPFLRKIGRLKKKIILSTGMSTLKEIGFALRTLVDAGTKKKDITILHCNTEYPTPFEDVNLSAMGTIRNRFNVNVGYSDHTTGLEIPIAAVALGATVIEKHFTLSRKMSGPDHRASIEPKELTLMVQSIRNIEKAIGDGIKKPSRSEIKNIVVGRKSIVASRAIEKGEIFTEDTIKAKRPGKGLSPEKWDKVIGKTAKKHFKVDDFIVLA